MSLAIYDTNARVGGTFRVLPDFLTRVAAGVRGYVSRAHTVRQLESLDNRLLMDIGLKRSEIHKMVWGSDR